jgi:hypothetical protein
MYLPIPRIVTVNTSFPTPINLRTSSIDAGGLPGSWPGPRGWYTGGRCCTTRLRSGGRKEVGTLPFMYLPIPRIVTVNTSFPTPINLRTSSIDVPSAPYSDQDTWRRSQDQDNTAMKGAIHQYWLRRLRPRPTRPVYTRRLLAQRSLAGLNTVLSGALDHG